MWCLPTQDWKSPISSTSQLSHPWKSLDFAVYFVTFNPATIQSLPFMNSPSSPSSSVAASCTLSCFYPAARRVLFHHFSPFLKGTGQKEKHPKIHQPFFTDALEPTLMGAAHSSAGSTAVLPVLSLKKNIVPNYSMALDCALLQVWKAAVLRASGTC